MKHLMNPFDMLVNSGSPPYFFIKHLQKFILRHQKLMKECIHFKMWNYEQALGVKEKGFLFGEIVSVPQY